jgi:trichothecene 3-O-acetyltransferase
MIQNMTYTTYQLQKLITVPLGEIASALRVALDPKTTILPFHTRALATYMHGQADKSTVSPTSSLDLSVDIMLSSWAKIDAYDLDFNLGLGLPNAVRRPRFVPVQSLVYFMPRARDGEIAVAMCLQEEDMERLKADEEFAKYALPSNTSMAEVGRSL